MDEDDPDRQAILKRRRRWIALALVGASATAGATACACLGVAAPRDSGIDAGTDAEPADEDGG